MKVELLEWPSDEDWNKVKDRALVTIGKKAINPPNNNWKMAILQARHSPIRYIRFSFYLEVPYYVSVHLCRHVHAQPYVRSQRNDRQEEYDRNAARQDAEVCMIWDMNAEEFLNICAKRLCLMSSEETRNVVLKMKDLVLNKCPEFKNVLKPNCEWQNGVCYEFNGGCGKFGRT